ncbi:MAG: carbon storage regulator [Chlamydiales bacterium]|nr:carbon storage regulator [Chlamydiia bacterium]MCP5508197.1 carbon storage regulator [Chlamydiales bacterium]
MLVLTRKSDEKIVIKNGKNKIVITILRVQSGKASIGIDASEEWGIFREELLQEQEQKEQFAEAELAHCTT